MQQEEHSGLKSAVTIILMIAAMMALYVMYRYSKNPSGEDLHMISDLSALPASTCTISSGSFLGASAGKVYIAGGRLREDMKVIQGGEERLVHRIFLSDNNGTMYVWFEGADEGIRVSNVYDNGGFGVADGAVVCKPWWIVNDQAFVVPYSVTFPSESVI